MGKLLVTHAPGEVCSGPADHYNQKAKGFGPPLFSSTLLDLLAERSEERDFC